MFTPIDQSFMRRALELAERGLHSTSPNPRVGAVVVKDGRAIGEGFHQVAGEAHAEVNAVRDARSRAGHEAVRGATVYVTLEPCNHHGKTPPCADFLVSEGVARVVAAMEDPNPRVAGTGFDRLRAAGIDVRVGLLAQEAQELNVGFVSRMSRGLPWTRLKVAASLDGKTALANGESQWITGPQARRDGHAWRARACAVLTGIGTVIEDDPQLNVRDVVTPRQPIKVVVDSALRTPPSARVLGEGRVLIACAIDDAAARRRLEDAAAARECALEFLVLPDARGQVDLGALVRELGRREINELHVEAGFTLNGALLRQRCADEVLIYFAASIIGHSGQGMFDLPELTRLDERLRLKLHRVTQLGDDLRLIARIV
ncbi:MAG: bifunctional diaminohydroxyphosphoribosylaminopyrimidine deaminase/5-amino-6-(5-phosphoribosylamino)uracil reductase RibD [Burkholderiales bacterium]|nr:bifunctional diaminohydroxyphosphoribosylaminopyrimidine deaminase/5-amino-6-(5-phosphoribosylamino)uracil reductase RibD [Burkholderiales bacterium]